MYIFFSTENAILVIFSDSSALNYVTARDACESLVVVSSIQIWFCHVAPQEWLGADEGMMGGCKRRELVRRSLMIRFCAHATRQSHSCGNWPAQATQSLDGQDMSSSTSPDAQEYAALNQIFSTAACLLISILDVSESHNHG
jgi:hypothetical protein